MKEALKNAVEALKKKVVEARAEHKVKLGETMAPRPAGYVEDDPKLGPCTDKWVPLVDKEDKALDKLLLEAVSADREDVPAGKGLFSDDNVWVWGGPTPEWGGTTDPDSLVKGADYFGAKNVVYMYGPTNKEMIQRHSKFQKVFCQVSNICRAPGAQPETDLENADKLGRLSLECPNVVGAMIDDMYNLIPQKGVGPIADALRKHNKNLKLYGVVYKHNFDEYDYTDALPYLDGISLWFWNKNDLLEIDETIERATKLFPGKAILMGVFIHEYGLSDVGTPPKLLERQLMKARKYLAEKKIDGIIILGDREIKKWPESAAAAKNYIQAHRK